MSNSKSETMQLKVKLIQNDFLKFNYFINKGFLIKIAIFGLFVLVAVFAFPGINNTSLSQKTSLLLSVGLIYIILLGYIVYNIYIRTVKTLRYDNTILEEKIYTLSSKGINIQSSSGTSELKWDNIIKATELKNIFVLLTSQVGGLIIPKRSMGTFKDIETFRNILNTNLDINKLYF